MPSRSKCINNSPPLRYSILLFCIKKRRIDKEGTKKDNFRTLKTEAKQRMKKYTNIIWLCYIFNLYSPSIKYSFPPV